MPVAVFTLSTVSDEVANETEVADLTGACRADFLLEVEQSFGALPVVGAVTELSSAPEAGVFLF